MSRPRSGITTTRIASGFSKRCALSHPASRKNFFNAKARSKRNGRSKASAWSSTGCPSCAKSIDNEQIVFLPEGEKCADSLVARGLIATTNPGGAGTPAEPGCRWRSEFNELFRDADVVLIADNDAIGREHMRIVATNLLPVVRCLRILDLRAIWPDIEQSDDIFDWFERGGGSADRLLNIIGDLAPLSEVLGVERQRHRAAVARRRQSRAAEQRP